MSWEQEKERDIFKLAKMRERESRDLDHVKCIKSDNQEVLVKDNYIKERWREYFNKLLNAYSIGALRLREDILLAEQTFYCRIRVEEVNKALARMKTGKATSTDGIPIEAWKCRRNRMSLVN